jgi:HSF-type DNA-binding
VKDLREFCRRILPECYRHNSFDIFVRLLHFDVHTPSCSYHAALYLSQLHRMMNKVRKGESLIWMCVLSRHTAVIFAQGFCEADSDQLEFLHESFLRSRRDLLVNADTAALARSYSRRCSQ